MNWRVRLGNGRPVTWYDLWLLDLGHLRENLGFFRGNLSFGFWSGLRANLTLNSPLANFLLNWRHRNSELRFDESDLENAAIIRQLSKKE